MDITLVRPDSAKPNFKVGVGDLVEDAPIPIDDIHLVDRKNDVADAHQLYNMTVTFRSKSLPSTVHCVHQRATPPDPSGRCGRGHVSGVLLVPGWPSATMKLRRVVEK